MHTGLQVIASWVNVYLRPNPSRNFNDASSSADVRIEWPGGGALCRRPQWPSVRDKVKLPLHHPSVTIRRDNQTATRLYHQQHRAR